MRLLPWLATALLQAVLPHDRRAYCEPCGKRRPVGHFDREHGRAGDYWC